MATKTVLQTMESYLESVALSRSPNTARTYRNALAAFAVTLESVGVDIENQSASDASEDWVADFAMDLKNYAPASERLYLTAVTGWFEYLAAERIAQINLPRLRLIIRRRARKPGKRLPQFPRSEIEQIIDHVVGLSGAAYDDEQQRLRNLRDRAFILTLADTGLRVHEICNLRRGDIDWNEGRAILIGKGDREAVVRFSSRSLAALRDYLSVRGKLDGQTGKPLHSLPIFARHDLGAGKHILPISTTTGRAIVHQRASESLGSDTESAITPHSFRHYFVTTVLRASGGNLKLAQELARHRNIAVTQRYAHLSDDELDRGYHEIFDQSR